jgi:transposase-like protein
MALIAITADFGTSEACFDFLEKMRWPAGVRCVRECGSDKISRIVTKEGKRNNGRAIPARHLYQCLACGHQFTATTGTLFNDTHLPIHKWFFAVALMTNAKKGMSAKQMQRDLNVSYTTAWYLCHRIRDAMKGEVSVGRGRFGRW